MEHGIAHREAIEDVHLINHVIVTHREELSDSLYRRIHREDRVGGSTDGETHHCPERTDTIDIRRDGISPKAKMPKHWQAKMLRMPSKTIGKAPPG